jgi:hypothetical protein
MTMPRKQPSTPVDLADLQARVEVLARYALRRAATAPAWSRRALVLLASSTAEAFAGYLDDCGVVTPSAIQDYLVNVTLRRLPVTTLGDLAPIVRFYLDPSAAPADLKRALVAAVHTRAHLESTATPLLPDIVYDDEDGMPVPIVHLLDYQLECLHSGLTPLVDGALLLDVSAFLPRAGGRDQATCTSAELIEHRDLAQACAHLFANYAEQRRSILERFERRAIAECIMLRGTPDGALGTLRFAISRHVHPDEALPTRFRPLGTDCLTTYIKDHRT